MNGPLSLRRAHSVLPWAEGPEQTQCVEGLPGRNSDRTNSPKSAWEVTPYYTRCFDKGKLFIRGRKPRELAEIAKITERQWGMYQNHLSRQNPILIGLRYLKVFEQESITSYAKAAQVLGVSRIRVYQLTSLVTKLPPEITEFLLMNADDPDVLRTFTERRLRPLTALPTKKSQMRQFTQMLARVPGAPAPSCSAAE